MVYPTRKYAPPPRSPSKGPGSQGPKLPKPANDNPPRPANDNLRRQAIKKALPFALRFAMRRLLGPVGFAGDVADYLNYLNNQKSPNQKNQEDFSNWNVICEGAKTQAVRANWNELLCGTDLTVFETNMNPTLPWWNGFRWIVSYYETVEPFPGNPGYYRGQRGFLAYSPLNPYPPYERKVFTRPVYRWPIPWAEPWPYPQLAPELQPPPGHPNVDPQPIPRRAIPYLPVHHYGMPGRFVWNGEPWSAIPRNGVGFARPEGVLLAVIGSDGKTQTQTQTQLGIKPGVRVRARSRTRERKFNINPRVGALLAFAARLREEVYDMISVIESLHDTLPKNLRKGKKPQEKMLDLYNHWDKVDVPEAVDNIVKWWLTDKFVGKYIEGPMSDAARQLGLPPIALQALRGDLPNVSPP